MRASVDVVAASVPQVAPRPELRERLVGSVGAEASRIEAAQVAPTAPRRTGWRGFAARPATAMVAGAALVAGVAAGYFIHSSDGVDHSVVDAHATAAAAPGSVSAALDRVDGSGTLEVRRMPALRGGDVYEVWAARGPTMAPQSTFVLRRDGSANAAVPDLDGATAVLVTREPPGGSAHPTSPPLLRAAL